MKRLVTFWKMLATSKSTLVLGFMYVNTFCERLSELGQLTNYFNY